MYGIGIGIGVACASVTSSDGATAALLAGAMMGADTSDALIRE